MADRASPRPYHRRAHGLWLDFGLGAIVGHGIRLLGRPGCGRCDSLRRAGGLDAHSYKTGGLIISDTFSTSLPETRSEMRFLGTYLIVVIVFAFGFVCAAMFTVGMPTPRRAPRDAKPYPPAWRAHP